MCVSVALVMQQHAKRMRCVILSSVARPPKPSFFNITLQMALFSKKKLLMNIKYVLIFYTIFVCNISPCGPGSSVGIATGYGLDGPAIESRWGEIFRTCPDRPWGQPSLLYNRYRVFPGGRKRPERDADPSPPSSAEV
jgi:hypothetical protein